MMKSAGRVLDQFDLSAVQKPTSSFEIQDVRFIASYNWSNSKEPVIFVPGAPARWNPPSLPYQVARDNGQVFIDQNSHRSPSASFDPFFQALLTMHRNFDMNPIGLTTDRNSLRKLLHFVSGRVPKSWRIEVDLIEDTMFFTRWEENQLQIITGARDSGYGHEFEKAFLTYESSLQESSGNHRIIRYNMGGVECLVRFEVDGYLDDGPSIDDQIPAVDELSQALSDLNVQSSMGIFASSPAAKVKVVERGRLVDNKSILELKSRSANVKMQEVIPQLWISQTHHLFVGRHKEGLVEVEPERFSMDEHFPAWESRNRENLNTLVGLITGVKEVAKRAKGGKCMLVCHMEEKPRVLRVYERNGNTFFLPKGVREECWGNDNQNARS